MMTLKKSQPLLGRADIMANIGQSTPSTRDSDLPDPCGEKRELRRMVQELEAKNERLRTQRDHYERGLHDVRGRAAKLMQKYDGGAGYHSLHTTAEHYLENFDSGGDHDD